MKACRYCGATRRSFKEPRWEAECFDVRRCERRRIRRAIEALPAHGSDAHLVLYRATVLACCRAGRKP